MSEIKLSTKGYIGWDINIRDHAVSLARKLIDHYNEGKRSYKYEIEQTTQVEKYMLMKVWHILSGSGICMLHRVYKRKNKLHVSIELGPQSPEYIDSSDSESESEYESDSDEDPSPASSTA